MSEEAKKKLLDALAVPWSLRTDLIAEEHLAAARAEGREELQVPLLALIDKAQEFQGYKYVAADDLLDLLTGESTAVLPLAVELADIAQQSLCGSAREQLSTAARDELAAKIEARLREYIYAKPAPPSPKVDWIEAASEAIADYIAGIPEWTPSEVIPDGKSVKGQLKLKTRTIITKHAPNLDEMERRAAEAVWEHHNGKPPSAVEQAGIGFARLTATIRKSLEGK